MTEGRAHCAPDAREQCAAHGHVWIEVVAGLSQCVRCGTEVFDLDAGPMTVTLPGDEATDA